MRETRSEKTTPYVTNESTQSQILLYGIYDRYAVDFIKGYLKKKTCFEKMRNIQLPFITFRMSEDSKN